MKWLNKGHEFDVYAGPLVKNFNEKQNKFYIFGAGILGEELKSVIEKTDCFAGFIDNDYRKQISGVGGAKVISLQEYLDRDKDGLVIIAADIKNIPVITEQLNEAGLKREKDFYEYTEFMKDIFPALALYANDQLYIELAQICLTERCSLKCKKCAHACYAVNVNNKDMSIEIAKESADYFFDYVDIIKEFVLIGGEPFLYQDLNEIIEYVGGKYREKIMIFSITTNGTIMPDQRTLDLCKKYNVTIRISDYSVAVKSLAEKYERLQEKLEKNQIAYTMSDKDAQWMDYGFESVDRSENEEVLIQTFDKCKTPCREIRGSRYYYCVMARSVSENLEFGVGEKDYLDLKELKSEDKKIIFEFQMGFSEKGYLDMCRHCYGADAVKHPVPIAEQVRIL